MIAIQMVVRCSKCGRTFIRSMGGTQSISRRLFRLDASPVCNKCKYADSSGVPSGGILGGMLKKRKK